MTHYVLPFVHTFCFSITIFLSQQMLFGKPATPVQRAGAIMFFCFSLWSLGNVFVQNSASSAAEAWLGESISSIGWTLVFPATLAFFVVFIEKKELLRAWYFYVLLLIVPALVVYAQWTHSFLVMVQVPFGWAVQWPKNILAYAYYAFCVVVMGTYAWMYAGYMKREKNRFKKQEASLFFLITATIFNVAFLLGVVLPNAGMRSVPNLSPVAGFLLCIGMYYAITRYNMFVVTPSSAAENILATVSDALILVDNDKTIIMVNRAALNILGYRQEELVGKQVNILFNSASFTDKLMGLDIRSHDIYQFDAKFVKKDTSTVPVNLSLSYVASRGNTVTGTVYSARDITERVKAEEEKERLWVKVMRSEKLSSLGELASEIVHEIRNPLSVMLGFAQILVARVKPGDELYEPAVAIEREAKRTRDFLQGLLAFSRAGTVEKELSDVNAVINTAMPLIEAKAKTKYVYIEVEQGHGLPQIYVSHMQLQQLIVNLCNNAVDAMPQTGGKLNLRTIAVQKDAAVFVEIQIQDNGSGIPQEIRSRIFEPFFTTKEEGKGTGLGLALVEKIIRTHQGVIELQSEPGRGTTFFVRLPSAHVDK